MPTYATPSGKQYTKEQICNRTEQTTTPGGMHHVAFFTGHHLAELQKQQQEQKGSSRPRPAGVEQQQLQPNTSVAAFLQGLLQQQKEQQQMLQLLARQQEQMQQQITKQQQGCEQPKQQQWPLAESLSAQSAEAPLLQDLQGRQQRTQQQLQQLLQQQQQKEQQCCAAAPHPQQLEQLHARSSLYSQRLGSVDPVGSIMQPWISSQPGLNAVLGAANNTSLLPTGGGGDNGSNAATLMALLDRREARLKQSIVDAVVAALGSNSGSSRPVPGSTGATAPATAAVADGVGAAGTGVPVAGAVASGAPISHHAAAPAAASNAAVKVQRGGAGKIGFPDLSRHSSLTELAEWYYVLPHQDTCRTPQQLEAAGRDDSFQWRGGPRHRFQRWAEYEQLLRAIELCRAELSEEKRRSSLNPHRVGEVDAVTAARKLDEQRNRLCLSVCEFREFINKSGKGYKKGLAKEQQLQEDAAAAANQEKGSMSEEQQESEHVGQDQQHDDSAEQEQQQPQHQEPKQGQRQQRSRKLRTQRRK